LGKERLLIAGMGHEILLSLSQNAPYQRRLKNFSRTRIAETMQKAFFFMPFVVGPKE
jgi:hypothetical protein